jgi:sugar phosphate isomerase/epimerase
VATQSTDTLEYNMQSNCNRRNFLAVSGLLATTAGLSSTKIIAQSESTAIHSAEPGPLFDISLAEWSLHRALQSNKIENLDFPGIAKQEFGIGAVEYVNQFFKDKANDLRYLTELKMRCDDADVKSMLIMCDGEGQLGDPDDSQRKQAVENHYKWVLAARFLGCHSIRVNAASQGSWEDQAKLAADGLASLSEFAAKYGLNVIVENHGGLSSNGKWLTQVIKSVGRANCGTLPDFGNFRVGTNKEGQDEWYDRYTGVAEMMPFAKAVSAKSYDFDEDGNEKKTDFRKMMKIVVEAGYHGYVGIEYEGGGLDEYEGVKATKRLLEKVRSELANA